MRCHWGPERGTWSRYGGEYAMKYIYDTNIYEKIWIRSTSSLKNIGLYREHLRGYAIQDGKNNYSLMLMRKMTIQQLDI
jgi:hypothetical protein